MEIFNKNGLLTRLDEQKWRNNPSRCLAVVNWSTHIVSVSLWTLLIILINTTTNFKTTFQYFLSIAVNFWFFFQSDGDLRQIEKNEHKI